MKRILCLVLVLACFAGLLSGCNTISEIAGNVMDAAVEELKAQVKAKLEEYMVEVVELKTAAGKINDDGGQYQFFCAALVKTNSESSASDCANALKKVFGDAGYEKQTDKAVENAHLVHKTITYSHSDYSGNNYYTIYVYVGDIGKIVDLDAIAEKLKEATQNKN